MYYKKFLNINFNIKKFNLNKNTIETSDLSRVCFASCRVSVILINSRQYNEASLNPYAKSFSLKKKLYFM